MYSRSDNWYSTSILVARQHAWEPRLVLYSRCVGLDEEMNKWLWPVEARIECGMQLPPLCSSMLR